MNENANPPPLADLAANPYASPRGMEPEGKLTVTVDREYLESVERRLEELEKRLQNHWLLSPRFLVRSIAVFFYGLVGYVVVLIPIYLIGVLILLGCVWLGQGNFFR